MLLLYTNKLIHLLDIGQGALILLILTVQVLLKKKKTEYFNLLNGFTIKKRGCIKYFVLNTVLREVTYSGFTWPHHSRKFLKCSALPKNRDFCPLQIFLFMEAIFVF